MTVTINENPRRSYKLRHYTVNIDNTHTISTTVTSHPGVARDWIHRTLHHNRNFRHRLIIGLGVQWTPPSLANYLNRPAATIQLCINHRCLIFQLHQANSSPRILRRILLDPRNTFVGLWNHSDSRKLRESEHELEMVPGMPVDMRIHVVDSNGDSLWGSSIAEIAREILGVEIDGMETDQAGYSDWEVDELSDDQVCRASVDAFVAFVVGLRNKAWNFNINL